MILLGLGGNLPLKGFTSPVENLDAVTDVLAREAGRIVARSRWYRTAPVTAEPQPWYVNGVVELATTLSPNALMALLLSIETRFGRVRSAPNAPRTVDLDLLAYGNLVVAGGEANLMVPHPRMHARAFVLVPLVEIAPTWRHPIVRRTASELLADLPPGQEVEVIGQGNVAGQQGLG